MNADEIEYMNAHGPYDHGIWSAALDSSTKPVAFGSSSLFATRAEVMSDKIIAFLKATFSTQELAKLKILDVGCYDGWILTKISSQIKAARIVGIEPRQKNIDKGVFARKVCNVQTDCEFVRGGYEELDEVFPGEKFDVVLCLGMAHHVSSVEQLVKSVAAKSSRLLIIDSMIIPELKADFAEMAAVINPIDIVYRKKEKVWGIAAYKLESPYFDGSTSGADLVNIPQESLIRMCIQVAGFTKTVPLMTEKDFYPKEFQDLRGVNEVMLASFRDESAEAQKDRWKTDALEYEALFCENPTTKTFLYYLFKNFNSEVLAPHFLEVFDGVLPQKNDAPPKESLSAEEQEIAGTIARAPFEKVLLELAKYQMAAGKTKSAANFLTLITTATNSDWRSFYRACYLLITIERARGNAEREKYYIKLLNISNSLFPLIGRKR